MKYAAVGFFLLFSFFQTSPVQGQPVYFGPLPMLQQPYVRQEFQAFVHYLESVLQRPVELAFRETNKGIIEGLQNDEIDLAVLGPLPFAVISKQDAGITALLQFKNADGTSGYTCSIGRFIGDDSTKVSDLEMKSIALTRPYSTCGYLMTEYMLKQHGLTLERNHYEYIGTHSQCALSVIEGQYDACGIKTSIGKKYEGLGLDLIKQSPHIPGFILVANQRTLSQKDIDRIRAHLLKLNPLRRHKDAEITNEWGEAIRYGARDISADDFQFIQQLLEDVSVPGVDQ